MSEIEACEHKNKIFSGGFRVCTDCGLCFEKEMKNSRDSMMYSEFLPDLPQKRFPNTSNKALIRANRLIFREEIKKRHWFPGFQINPIRHLLREHEERELERVYFILKRKMRYIRFKSLIFILYYIMDRNRRKEMQEVIEYAYDLGPNKWPFKATNFKYNLKRKYGLDIKTVV